MRMAASAKLHHGPVSGSKIWSRMKGVAHVIIVWRRRARDRDTLLRLNDHYLQDIGLTRQEVMMEFSKPFWRE